MQCNKCGTFNDPNNKFCLSCGNQLYQYNNYTYNNNFNGNYNNNYNYNNYNNQMYNIPKKNSNIGFYITICSILICTLTVIIMMVASNNNSTVFISHDNNEITNGTSSNGGSTYNTPSTTSIQPERTYDMDINDVSSAKNKIREDSTNQRSKCNKKVVEIEDRILKNYNISGVNFCELNYDLALEIEGVIKYIYNNYPNARGYLTNISVKNGSINDSYIAYFRPVFYFTNPVNGNVIVNKTTIMLNTTYFFNVSYFERAMNNAVNTKHFPKNATTYSSVAHEYGHYLSFVSMMKTYNVDSILLISDDNYSDVYKLMTSFSKGDYSKDLIMEAYNNYKSKTNTTMGFDEFRGSISGYAVAKDDNGNYIYDETIAEAFHDCYLNGNNAAPASIEIVKVLGSRLN